MESQDYLPVEFGDWMHVNLHLHWCYDMILNRRHPRNRWVMQAEKPTTVWFIEEGWGKVRMRGKELHADEGDCVILPSGEPYQMFASHVKLMSIGFSAKWSEGEPLLGEGLPLLGKTSDWKELALSTKSLADRLMELSRGRWNPVHETMDFADFLEVQQRFYGWFAILSSRHARPNLRPLGI